MDTSKHISEGSAGSHAPGEHAVAAPDDVARDPVCGMTVRRATAKWTTEHDGQSYFFCNPRCLTRFREAPDRYLKPADAPVPATPTTQAPATPRPQQSAAEASAGAVFVCPMHPEVRSPTHGTCPKCGMALEPETVTLEEPP